MKQKKYKYMLDTNILIYAKNENPEVAKSKFDKHNGKDICISAITQAELEYGVSRSSFVEENRQAMIEFLSVIPVISFDDMDARHYGDIRAHLEKKGIVIGGNDMLIAAHARSKGLILVTNNTREFCRVPGLKVEDWSK